jgi:hypothetical protein
MPEQQQWVQLTVWQQDGQEQQMLLETPVPSSFAREQLQLAYGPGLLLHEGSNALVSPTRELQPAERYIYKVSGTHDKGVWLPLALGRRISVLQPA